MLLDDMGRAAVLARQGELNRAQLSLFRPIKCMLASPVPTAEAIWARFIEGSSGGVVYVEDKFEGIRAQVHRDSTRVEIFSRDLKRITDQFPEIAEHACVFS